MYHPYLVPTSLCQTVCYCDSCYPQRVPSWNMEDCSQSIGRWQPYTKTKTLFCWVLGRDNDVLWWCLWVKPSFLLGFPIVILRLVWVLGPVVHQVLRQTIVLYCMDFLFSLDKESKMTLRLFHIRASSTKSTWNIQLRNDLQIVLAYLQT